MGNNFSFIYQPETPKVQAVHTCEPKGEHFNGVTAKDGAIIQCNDCGQKWILVHSKSSDQLRAPRLYGEYTPKWKKLRWYHYKGGE